MVDLHIVTSGSAPVDMALYDSFASPLAKNTRLDTVLRDPTIGSVAVYSFTSDPAAVRDSLEAGAHGFLSKFLTAPELVSGIEQIATGNRVTLTGSGLPMMGPDRWPAKEAGLSPREAEVVSLIVQGLSNDQIAEQCYLSLNTVKTYVRSAYRKMGVTSRAQPVAWSIENGWQIGLVGTAGPASCVLTRNIVDTGSPDQGYPLALSAKRPQAGPVVLGTAWERARRRQGPPPRTGPRGRGQRN